MVIAASIAVGIIILVGLYWASYHHFNVKRKIRNRIDEVSR